MLNPNSECKFLDFLAESCILIKKKKRNLQIGNSILCIPQLQSKSVNQIKVNDKIESNQTKRKKYYKNQKSRFYILYAESKFRLQICGF